MAKWGKRLFGLAAIGGAVAGLVYYLKSKEDIDMNEFEDDFDDDDFDLDNDLKASGEREYVPLTPKKAEDDNSETSVDTEADDADSADAAAEIKIDFADNSDSEPSDTSDTSEDSDIEL